MGFTLPSPSKTHSPLHSQRHSPESSLHPPCRNYSPFPIVLPIPYPLKVKSNRKLLTIGMQHNAHHKSQFPHLYLPPFHSRKVQHPPSRITPILLETLFHSLSSPFSNTSPSQTTQFPTLPIPTPKLTKHSISFNFQFNYPSPIFFIPLPTPIQQSPPICFQSDYLPSHQHQHAPTNSSHPSSPIRQSISNSPPKEKKAQHTQSPITPSTPPLHSKESTAMHLYNLTIHKPSVVQRSIYGWRRLC